MYYRVINKNTLKHMLETMTIWKYRNARIKEQDYVFMCKTIDECIKLCPDTSEYIFLERLTHGFQEIIKELCRTYPKEYKLIKREPQFYVVEIEPDMLDESLITSRPNMEDTIEYLYPYNISLEKVPTIYKLNDERLTPFYMLEKI